MSSLADKLAALAVLALGVTAGLVAARGAMNPATPADEPASETEPLPLVTALSRMQLDETQREAIQRLLAADQERVASLERTLETTEEILRREEVAKPFDATRVNALVARQAEVLAHLRGTESRVVSEISDLLTDEQQRIFVRLRISGDADEAGLAHDAPSVPAPPPDRAEPPGTSA